MRRIDDGLSSEDRCQISEVRRQIVCLLSSVLCIPSFVLLLLMFTCSAFISCSPTTESESADIRVVPPRTNIWCGAVSENEAGTTGGPPLLVVDTSAPLLLDEPAEEKGASAVAATRAAVENTACFVCHANYKTESLSNDHAGADVGCVDCHGQSSAHQNDENNITPPDTIYSADKIDPLCQSCHKAHDIPPKEIITRWLKRKAEKNDSSCRGCHEDNDIPPEKVVARWTQRGLDETDPDRIICTDCHGDHRMKVRTIIWDKRSGKLLRTNRGD